MGLKYAKLISNLNMVKLNMHLRFLLTKKKKKNQPSLIPKSQIHEGALSRSTHDEEFQWFSGANCNIKV